MVASARCGVQTPQAISAPSEYGYTPGEIYPAGVVVVSCLIFVWKMASH